jgi:hypothetical protein
MQYEKKGFGYVYQNVMRNKKLTIEAKSIYAYLASFSGNNEMCYPSIQLILKELGISKSRFYKHMELLINNGIVTKQQEKFENRFSKNTYIISSFPNFEDTQIEDTQNRDTQIEDTQNLTTKRNNIKRNRLNSNSSNNIIIDTADALPTTSKFHESSFEMLCVEAIINSCLELYPNSKVPSTYKEKEKWAIEIDRLKRIDKRGEEEIKKALQFAVNDGFWKPNIRSTKKFREKFETLIIQANRNNSNVNKINRGQLLQDQFVENMKGWLNDTEGLY